MNYYIVTGYNCAWNVKKCIESIREVDKEGFIVVYDDASNDNTIEKADRALENSGFWIKAESNYGQAFSRWCCLIAIYEKEEIPTPISTDRIILVDMDDHLLSLPDFEAELTIGSTLCKSGKTLTPNYTDEQLNGNIWEHGWRAFPLRAFTWDLWQQANLDEDWFKDEKGQWFRVCTDVALMFPLMQEAESVQQVRELTYFYNDEGDHVGRAKYPLKKWTETSELIKKRMKERYE